jgi:rhamnosyltransferase
MNRAIVIAHFHAGGLVQANLRALVQALLALPARIVFVSTGATPESLATLPAGVQAIARPNTGYDFESYRIGIEALGDLVAFDELVLMNSSLVCIDPQKLCERFFRAPRADADVFALTGSHQVAPHLQSFLVGFSRRAIVSEAFGAWWRSLEPLDERDAVIGRYELGMSAHFARHGFRLAAAFRPTGEQKFHALCRHFEAGGEPPAIASDGTVTLDLQAADVLNPMHFMWDALLDEFGVMKAELLKRNPHSIDLRRVSRMLLHDASFRALVQDVLAEPAPSSSPAGSPPSAR